MKRPNIWARMVCLSLLALAWPALGKSEPLVWFDLTNRRDAGAWRALHDISALRPSGGGLIITIAGDDPYLAGPACDLPPNVPLEATIRLKSDVGGGAQLFYFTQAASEESSVRFDVPAGKWVEAKLDLPALGPGYRFRFDPPGDHGSCILASLKIAPRKVYVAPAWPRPVLPAFADRSLTIKSGSLELIHDGRTSMGFEITVDHQPMAIGLDRYLIGYETQDKIHWLEVNGTRPASVSKSVHGLTEIIALADEDQGHWRIVRTYSAGKSAGEIKVEVTCQVDQDRNVLFMPMLGVLPGASSFGQRKSQGILAGLEYLDDEPSSSEADIIGPGSHRQVPDSAKMTLPLMAITSDGLYVGLIWEQSTDFAALFDSPDRLFHSGGHLMGLIYPGANGSDRVQGDLLPRQPKLLEAGKPIHLKATLIGGKGHSAAAAVREYVTLRGLPPLPKVNLHEYLKTAAAGWLDSQIRQEASYRHAFPGAFQPHPAADAAMDQQWLAAHIPNEAMSKRLLEAAKNSIAAVPPNGVDFSTIGHVRYPAQSLIFGHVNENAEAAAGQGHALLSRFEPDGSLLYRPQPGGADYGKTHFARDANGLTAQHVALLLQCAAVSGDRELLDQGMRLLHAMDRFALTVPRGAQTWECPLHTPDILASAHLIRAYTLGYELTGDPALLEKATYWAWTGVPFVYLDDPVFDDDVQRTVGAYASVPVLGATHWQAPNWMGTPVQWCALVYADALYQLQRYDSNPIWKQLADGITLSGIQQTWPIGSNKQRVGLLPDSFNLRSQTRNDPAINPATLQAEAVRLFGGPPLYDSYCFRKAGAIVHAPGSISAAKEDDNSLSFTVQSWVQQPYYVLISGISRPPTVSIEGAPTALNAPHRYIPEKNRLILHLHGTSHVRISFPKRNG